MKNIKYWLPSIIIMVIIFLASNDPASGEKSDFITRFIWHFINSLTGYQATAIDEGTTTFIIRKTAHVSEYTILAISFFYALFKTFLKNSGFYKIYFLTVILSVFYSSSDEFHQSVVAGRVGTYEDVLIDTVGILISIFILPFLYKRLKKS